MTSYCDGCDLKREVTKVSVVLSRAHGIAYDAWYCENCVKTVFFSCVCCLDVFGHQTYGHLVDEGKVCEVCLQTKYTTCSECDSFVKKDSTCLGFNGKSYCKEICIDSHIAPSPAKLMDMPEVYYGNHPSLFSSVVRAPASLGFIGKPSDNLFLGVELETVAYKDGYRAVSLINKLLKNFAITKTDGSLLGYGIEIVTAPATFEEQQRLWKPLFDSPIDGLRSWNTKSACCGMHVHASRKAVTPLQIGKMVVFLNKRDNKKFVATVAGRYNKTYCKYFPGKTLEDSKAAGRYEAINLQNEHTIEFRIFRGTLKRESFFKNLEFVHALIKFSMVADPEHLVVPAFTAWLCGNKEEYPNLYNFLVGKGFIDPVVEVAPEEIMTIKTKRVYKPRTRKVAETVCA